jgi:death-on-curing protein
MGDPKWITQPEIERLHTKLIDQTGGSNGSRDSSLLDSALARPRNLNAYGEQDMFQLAASYAEGLARNHAFVDGNKRIGFSAADIFLFKNGLELLPSKDGEHVHMMENLAQGHINREDAAQHFKEHCRAIAQD